MGRRSVSGGVRAHGDRIQFDFQYQFERCRPTLALKPTPANMKYARRLADEIRAKIKHGTFSMADYFPDYRDAGRPSTVRTVAEYIDLWLASGANLSPSTRNGYRKASAHWRAWFGEQRVDAVRHSEAKVKLNSHPWGSQKTRNNVLSVGKQIFALAFRDLAISSNPLDGVDFSNVQTDEPDPFSIDEIEAMLKVLAARFGDGLSDYYEFAFFTGLRPSEQIELQWGSIDERRRCMRIDAVRVRGLPRAGVETGARNQDGEPSITMSVRKESTKTHHARDVQLNERAWAVLARQKVRTKLAGASVFLNPHTGRPWQDENKQGQHFRTALKIAKLRHRAPYQTRHTYATMLLMAGANPAWAAGQLGHSVEVFFRKYARWIEDAARHRGELAKLHAFLGDKSSDKSEGFAGFGGKK